MLGLVMVAVGGCAAEKTTAHIVYCPGEHVLAVEERGAHDAVFATTADVGGLASVRLLGERGYAVAYRHDGGIAVGALAPDHTPLGGLVALSHASEQSAPVLTPSGEGVLVAWSERAANDEPWQVRLAYWVPGAGVRSLDSQTVPARGDSPPRLTVAGDEVRVEAE